MSCYILQALILFSAHICFHEAGVYHAIFAKLVQVILGNLALALEELCEYQQDIICLASTVISYGKELFISLDGRERSVLYFLHSCCLA